MSNSDLVEYEQACLRHTQEILDRIEATPSEHVRTDEVRLDGTYPATRLVARGRNELTRKDFERDWGLWTFRMFRAADDRMYSPQHVANLIATWIHEG